MKYEKQNKIMTYIDRIINNVDILSQNLPNDNENILELEDIKKYCKIISNELITDWNKENKKNTTISSNVN